MNRLVSGSDHHRAMGKVFGIHRLALLIFAIVALAGGCRGKPGVVSAKSGGTVTSGDGLVTLVFPPGALAKDTKITIDRIEAPALAELDPIEQAYHLAPDGIEFNLPVEATIILDGVAAPTEESPAELVTFYTHDDVHGLEPLEAELGDGAVGQETIVNADEDTVAVRGNLWHFSDLTGVKYGLRWGVFPPVSENQAVGARWSQRILFSRDTAAESNILLQRIVPSATQPVSTQSEEELPNAVLTEDVGSRHLAGPFRFQCDKDGKGRYWFLVYVGNAKGPHSFMIQFPINCGTAGTTGTDTGTGTGESTGGSGETEGDECVTEPIESVLDELTDQTRRAALLAGLAANFGTIDQSGLWPSPMGSQMQPQADGEAGVCSTTANRVETDQEVSLAKRALGGLAVESRPQFVFPCGPGPDSVTLCPTPADPMPPGEYVIAAHVLLGDVPLSDATTHYQYGFVFDADGDPNNNYQPPPQWENDFFQDTDLWFVASYTPTGGWELQITDARDGNLQPAAINARIIVAGNSLVLIAPTDAFAVSDPSYRVTAFQHDGRWADDPDSTGDIEPPVDGGLRPFDGAVP